MMRFVFEDKIKGGLADKMSKKDIAKKFGVTVAKVNKELEMGTDIEMEHVNSKKLSKEIAMDHLVEIPDYYTRLKKMEKQAEKYWKGKIKESTKEFIKRRIRESIDLSVTDETPVTTAYNILNDGNLVGQIELGKFNQNLAEDELEIILIKISEEFRGQNLGKETIDQLWVELPTVNRLILMPTSDSVDFWTSIGATPINGGSYYQIVRPT